MSSRNRPPTPGIHNDMNAGSNHPLLERDREVSGAMADDELDALFAAVAGQTVDRSPGLRDRIRELPTATRTAMAAVGLVAAGGAALAVLGLRGDLADVELVRFVGSLLVLLSGAVASAGLGLRGLHQPGLGRRGAALVALSLAIPAAMALIPGWWPSSASPAGWAPHVMCLLNGVGATTAMTLVVLLFQRPDHPAAWRLLSAAGAGGMVGMAVQQLACPAGGVLHVLGAHSLLGLVVGAGVVGIAALRR